MNYFYNFRTDKWRRCQVVDGVNSLVDQIRYAYCSRKKKRMFKSITTKWSSAQCSAAQCGSTYCNESNVMSSTLLISYSSLFAMLIWAQFINIFFLTQFKCETLSGFCSFFSNCCDCCDASVQLTRAIGFININRWQSSWTVSWLSYPLTCERTVNSATMSESADIPEPDNCHEYVIPGSCEISWLYCRHWTVRRTTTNKLEIVD